MISKNKKGEFMQNSRKLKIKGINLLKSYFTTPTEKKLIGEKFNNISGKTGRYFVPETLYQKRTARKNRSLIPFEHVLNSNLTYEQLNTFEGGVVVEFVNNEFFNQEELQEELQNSVFKKLKNKLGTDDNVSAIINIRSTGDSSSQIQRVALEKLNIYLKSNNLFLKDVLIQRKQDVSYSGQGNDVWKGFVYYSIRGGQQEVLDSHVLHNINSNKVQLFNPSVEYAGEQVSNDITLVLIYFALFSVPLDNRGDEWINLKKEYLNYFETRYYINKSLKNYVETHISLNLVKDTLIDPIQAKPIDIKDFVIKKRKPNSVDISHQTSVNKYSYVWDDNMKILLTAARPTNLFWSKHLSNMMQQNFSLKEYFLHQREIVEQWNKYGIDKLEDF